jgi:hypothetical protein
MDFFWKNINWGREENILYLLNNNKNQKYFKEIGVETLDLKVKFTIP